MCKFTAISINARVMGISMEKVNDLTEQKLCKYKIYRHQDLTNVVIACFRISSYIQTGSIKSLKRRNSEVDEHFFRYYLIKIFTVKFQFFPHNWMMIRNNRYFNPWHTAQFFKFYKQISLDRFFYKENFKNKAVCQGFQNHSCCVIHVRFNFSVDSSQADDWNPGGFFLFFFSQQFIWLIYNFTFREFLFNFSGESKN